MTTESPREARHAALVRAIAWLGVLITAAILLAASRYKSRDPDSTVYAEISARLSALPFSGWIAPDWGGSWGFSGPFREHPIGIFVLPALLARAGYPAAQAAFAVGAVFSVVSLWLIGRVAAPLVKEHEAVAVQWAALILPIAFVYRVRANQEYPVLVLTLLALYATHRSRRAAVWIAGVVSAACGLALVKGIFVVFQPVVCALWLLLIRDALPGDREPSPRNDGAAWLGLVCGLAAVAALAWAYERMYQQVSGDSFMSFYLHDRIADNAGLVANRAFSLPTKLYNAVWYLARVAWFAMPGSLALLLSVGRARNAAIEDRRGLLFALLAAAVYVAAMSLGANKADRFIFPAYFLVGTAGALVAIRRWPGVDRVAQRLAALPPHALPLAWLLFFILTLATERRLPYVKLWST